LQGKRPNTPVNNLSLVRKCLEALNTFQTGKLLIELAKIGDAFDTELKRISLSLSALSEKEGVARSEFRISHDVLASILPLLSRKFASEEVLNLIIPLKSESLSKLALFYTNMLSDPIFSILCQISLHIESGQLNNINPLLASLSAFEMLFTFTLFSGRTNSFVRELVWATGAENRNTSLRMMDSIIKYNHPVFPQTVFDPSSKLFVGATETLCHKMFNRYDTSIDNALKTLELLTSIRSKTLSNEKKAELLFKSYFTELPKTDFIEPTLNRWKLSSLITQGLSFGPVSLTTKEATEMVFNKNHFGFPAWERPYFKAFQLWCNEFPQLKHHEILTKAGLTQQLGIEIIRYHSSSDSSRFLTQGRKYYTGL